MKCGQREALLYICPWLTEADADAILSGAGEDTGYSLSERLAHHREEHRAWQQVAADLYLAATGKGMAQWPGAAKAIAEVERRGRRTAQLETRLARVLDGAQGAGLRAWRDGNRGCVWSKRARGRG
jgi:hypothetical protein